jgi:hypothetical protein
VTYCIRSWQKQEAEKVDEEEENEEKRKEELYLCSNLETPWQVWEKNMQHPVSLSSAQQFPKLVIKLYCQGNRGAGIKEFKIAWASFSQNSTFCVLQTRTDQ